MSSAGRYGPREGWLSVCLLAMVLWCVVHSVFEAEWAADLDLLVPLTWLMMGVGIAAAKSGLRPWAAHTLAAVIAVEAIIERFGSRMTAVYLGGQAQRALLARGDLDRRDLQRRQQP